MKINKRLLIWGLSIVSATMLIRIAMEMQGPGVFADSEATNVGNRFDAQPIDNFVDFPCLDGAVPTDGLLDHGKCVRMMAPLNFDNIPERQLKKDCRQLLVGKISTPFCTYPPSADLISKFIQEKGSWEKELVDPMLDVMNRTENMMLFDVGSNIGVYCVSAALYKKDAVCLDANYVNLRKLYTSLHLGQLTTNVRLIWNAVSDKHETLRFHIAKGNYGSSRIADLKRWKMETEANLVVSAIQLNDLQDYPGFKDRPVFMKLDVESHELFVLFGAEEFFKKVDVRVIQTELAEPGMKYEVIDLFEKYGFVPFKDAFGKERLYSNGAFTTWPGDIYFIRVKPIKNSERSDSGEYK